MSRRRIYFWNFCQYLLILVVNVICYYHSLEGSFVFDDSVAILKNKDVTNLDSEWTDVFIHDFWGANITSENSHKSYRPLTILSFRFELKYSGGNATNMKTSNLLLHFLNCCLLMHFYNIVFTHGTKNRMMEILVATLFSIHPIHVEAVSGIVGRCELFTCLIFLVSSILYFQRFPRDQKNFSIADFIFLTVMGFLSVVSILFKENGITILPTIAAIDVIRNINLRKLTPSRLIPQHLIPRISILTILTIFTLLLRLSVQNFESPTFKSEDNPIAASNNTLTRILSQNYLYSLNCFLLLCPDWLSFDWSFSSIRLVEDFSDPRVFYIVIFYLSAGIVVIKSINNEKAIISLIILVIPFLPASGFIRLGFVIAERILYIPSIGSSILVALGFNKILKRTKSKRDGHSTALAFLGIFMLFQVLKTRQRASEWTSESLLFTSALKVCPNNAKVFYNIGRIKYDAKDTEMALKSYKRAIQLQPNYESAHMNLGNLYRELQDYEKAKYHLSKSVQILEEFPTAWMNLGIVLALLKEYEESESSYMKALKYRKNYANCFYNLGNLYIERKNYTQALANWKHTIALNPKHLKAWSNLLAYFDNQGLNEQVLQTSEVALTFLPNDTNILFSRANVFGKLGNFKTSEMLFKQIISIKPDNALYHANLGVLYHRFNKKELALKHYKRALELDSNLKNARNNLLKLQSLM